MRYSISLLFYNYERFIELNNKKIIYELCVCQKCRKPFKTNGMNFYCPACNNFGSRRVYWFFIFSLIYYLVVNCFEIVSDFKNLRLINNNIFFSFYLSAFLLCFCMLIYVWKRNCKKVGK